MKQITLLATIGIFAIVIGGAWAAPQARIAGGDDAVPGQIPYQAALSIAGLYTCGAVILSERYALTSLYCVCSAGSDRPWPPQMFSFTAGTTDLYSGGVRIVVEEITVNPNYHDLSTGIALLKLTQPLVFSDYIQPIELAQTNPPLNADVEISGWGRTKEGQTDMYRYLQINGATVVDSMECTRVLGRSDPDILCMSHPRKNGICMGDFGGPAVYNGKVVGIASVVMGECGSLLPDIFTSVAEHYEWIQKTMEL
ncbi:serine protease SP24D [Musca vetustissima]|uniref:serine protease SP24D n=1 Tax=Musca vetustissima TaxID=27455 RepID=UPI002AB6E427|nr:serine protease SP24D [Musca vetustissima]